MDGIEIYLRRSGDRTLMMFHIPASMRKQFLQAMQGGAVNDRQTPIIFEAPVLPEWTPDPDNPNHIRVAVDQVSVQFGGS